MGDKQQKLTGTTFVLVRPDGQLLLQLRDERSRHYPNTWCFPGEGKEGNEGVIETARRGIREEYGIEIAGGACQFIAINNMPRISQEIGVVLCKIENDQVPIMREGKEMRWMAMDEIKKLRLGFEQNKFLPLIEKLLRPR